MNEIFYINKRKKRIVGRNNQQVMNQVIFDYDTIEGLSFQIINDQNQIQNINDEYGLYLAGSIGMGKESYELLFLSKDYEITSGNLITFKVETYTKNYLNYIKKKFTEINLEIGQISLNNKNVILRDNALACPRVYVEGLSPAEIDSNDYYTKAEVDELIEINMSQSDWDEEDPTSASFIKNKPTNLSDFTNDVGYITGYTETDPIFTSTSGLFELKEDAFDGNYDSLTNAPTNVSHFTNDAGYLSGETDPIYTAASGRIVFLNNSGKINKELYSTNKQAIYIDPIVYDSGEITPFQLVYNSNYEIFYNTLDLENNILNIDKLDFPTTDLSNGEAVTLENWLRFYNQTDAETFLIDEDIQVIDEIPDVLSGTQTHVFIRRLFRDENGQYHESMSYSHSF